MKPTLIFATNNRHKVQEIEAIIGDRFLVLPLKEAGIEIDIPEPHDTLEKNAQEKAQTIFNLTGKNCFSEDTGLEVKALNGEPGVRSARYAAESKNFCNNIEKLLFNMFQAADRSARFRTVICLIYNGTEHLFEGICEGSILHEVRGEGGFGYDPLFIPAGSNKSFAEMTLPEKNLFSHRKKATDKLITFLNDCICKE